MSMTGLGLSWKAHLIRAAAEAEAVPLGPAVWRVLHWILGGKPTGGSYYWLHSLQAEVQGPHWRPRAGTCRSDWNWRLGHPPHLPRPAPTQLHHRQQRSLFFKREPKAGWECDLSSRAMIWSQQSQVTKKCFASFIIPPGTTINNVYPLKKKEPYRAGGGKLSISVSSCLLLREQCRNSTERTLRKTNKQNKPKTA